MTQIIISPASNSGLSVTTGLSFGIGLILGYSGGFRGGILFAGAGGLTPTTRETDQEAARFSGTGSLSARPSGKYATNPATFAGGGLLLPTVNLALHASVGFGGSGGAGS